MTKRQALRLLPLIVFVLLLALLARPLLTGHDPAVVDSPLIGKPFPRTLAQGLSPQDLQRGVTVVNFFASWCVACEAEQPVLAAMAGEGGARIIGIAYKDKPEKTREWLERHGNPFALIGEDARGAMAIEWGVYGVPETFVIADGIVRYRHVGPVTADDYREKFMPLMGEGKDG